jgi:hypothetical protein
MKAAQIYLTKKNFKIVTMYKLDSGSYILSQPIFILDKTVEYEELSKYISLALDNSKELSEKEEDKYRIGSKLLLKSLKETTFNKFYETSVSCGIYVENNNVTIEPYEFKGKDQGLVEDEKRVMKLESNISDIDLTRAVINALKNDVDVP